MRHTNTHKAVSLAKVAKDLEKAANWSHYHAVYYCMAELGETLFSIHRYEMDARDAAMEGNRAIEDRGDSLRQRWFEVRKITEPGR